MNNKEEISEQLKKRTITLNNASVEAGPVLYWMQRDQRVQDNWALLYAQQQAKERSVPLLVVFNLPPSHSLDTLRTHDFMLQGLEEVAAELSNLAIPFMILSGLPREILPGFIKEHNIGEVVGDFNPLRYLRRWKQEVADAVSVRYTEVDAHNIIPCRVASDKQEFAAHTFRPKVHRQLKVWLNDIPEVVKHKHEYDSKLPEINWEALRQSGDVNRAVEPVDWLKPGTKAGLSRLKSFIKEKLDVYDTARNDPNANGISHLSPYLRHGQISAQRVALTVKSIDAPSEAKEAFLEELIVRRELTDNFCFYNQKYDKVEGAHAWAQKTIAEHEGDEREYVYTKEQFETAKTHDDLWNAMQLQMVEEGKMHGWCRMYWAKKILEWTPDVQTAINIALELNDRYELDGNDPNGVVGVMWSICGVHDRAWTERPVFGKIRYMNYNGAKRKFDVAAYVEKYSSEIEALF